MSEPLRKEDVLLINEIKRITKTGNIDNISRTVFYKDFYMRNQEIRWAFLASMVSRNAGWNMTDLKTNIYRQLLNERKRKIIFLTYERANWLIFSDAFPQLLLYEKSKESGRPLFHLLKYFGVSTFMVKEWERFWVKRDLDRLVISLIINEQHVIEDPVINHPFIKKNVFQSFSFKMQDILHFSTVLFPTLTGRLYGFSVHQFTEVKERIKVGKTLYWILFYAKESYNFHQFSLLTKHTGSRNDYEKYRTNLVRSTPKLQSVYPIITNNKKVFGDWYLKKQNVSQYYKKIKVPKKYDLSNWFIKKNYELSLIATIQHKLAKGGEISRNK